MKHSKGFALLMAAVMTMTMFPTGALASEGEYKATETAAEETEVEDTEVEETEAIETEVEELESVSSQKATEETSGKCGEDLTWNLDEEGILTISGMGDMYHFIQDDMNTSPWTEKPSIKKVVIEEGVSNICEEAFSGCTEITEVLLPDKLLTIEDNAFYGCTGLTSVKIPESVTSIGDKAFGWYEEAEKTLTVDGFSIYGHTNTAAETYAKENGFEFISIDAVTPEESEESDISTETETVEVVLHDEPASEGMYIIYFNAGDGFFYNGEGKKVKTEEYQIEKGDCIYYTPDVHIDSSLKKAFAGWSTDQAGKNMIDTWEYVPTKNTTIYAVWRDGWKITFNAGEGYFESYEGDAETKLKTYSDIVEKGKEMNSIYVPSPEIDDSLHKAFVGWSTDRAGKNMINVWDYVPTKDTTLYAVWKDAWKVTLDAGKGCFYGDKDQKRISYYVPKGDNLGNVGISEPEMDESAGKALAGWSQSPKGDNVIDAYEFIPTKDCVLYAVWKNAFKITINDADYDTTTFMLLEGSSLEWNYIGSDRKEEMARSGKVFSGWITDKDKKNVIKDLSDFVPKEDMIFNAVWKDAWKITYDAGEGYIGYEENDSKYTTLVEKGKPINEGYTFVDGIDWGTGWIPEVGIADSYVKAFSYWAEDKNGKSRIDDIEHFVPKKNMTIYAIWEDALTISFNMGKGHDPKTAKAICKKGDSLEGKYPWINSDLIDNKVFIGWATDSSGKHMISEETFIPKKNMTLYAIWKDAWRITLKSEDKNFFLAGDGKMADYVSSLTQKVIKGEPIGIFGNYDYSSGGYHRYGAQMVAVKNPESKVLAGWSTKKNGGDFMESLVGFVPDRDMTFYAVWKDAFTVTLNSGDGYVASSSGPVLSTKVQVLKGDCIGMDITAESDDESKAFAGWSTSKNGTDIIKNFRDYKPKRDITLYAVWKDAYTITFDTNGDDNLFIYPVKVAKGCSIGSTPYYYYENGNRPDGEVILWSTDPKGKGIIWDIENYVPKGNMTLYAIKKDAYQLTFDANGGFFTDSKKSRSYGVYAWLHTTTWNTEKHYVIKGKTVSDLPLEIYAQTWNMQLRMNSKIIGAIPEPHALDGVFKGWATDPKGKHMISDIAKYKPAGNVTIYAIWGDNRVSEIKLNKTAVKLEEGKSMQLEAKVLPETAANPKLTWSSSNKAIASVDNKGLVKAIKPGTAVIKASATDGSGKTASCTVTVSAKPAWVRLAGKGRYDTMAEIVKTGFTKTGGTVVVATGAGFKDALAAAGLAGLYDAPVILTDGKNLSPQAQQQLKRLKPSRIYIAGGEVAVSKNVFNSIKTLTGVQPKRCFGKSSAGTSAALAAAGSGWSDTAIIATNKTFKDALSAAPLSYSLHMPILLADNGKSLNADVLNALKKCGIKKVIIVGGKLAVTENVENQLVKNGIAKGNISRLAGNTAVDTSASIAEYGLKHGMTINGMGVATSQNYPDALAGAALCGHNNSVLVLADDKAMKNTSFPTKYKADFSKGYIFGGVLAVSDNVLKALQAAVK